MRILILTHRFPYPPDKGDRIRSWLWLRALSSIAHVDLLTFDEGNFFQTYSHELKKYLKNVYTVPLSEKTSPLRIVKSLMTGKSITEGFFNSHLMRRTLSELTAANHYDLILALCSSMGAQLLRLNPKTPWIVDMVDVDSAKWDYFAQNHKGFAKKMYARESRCIRRLEQQISERAKLCITISKRESQLLEKISHSEKTLTIPNGVDTEFFKPNTETKQFDKLLFVGQMDYFPNEDAVLWFAENVWRQLLMKFPDLTWYIVGRNPTRKVKLLSQQTNIVVTGAVADTRTWMKDAISINPIRIACGLQNKVLEAMSAALPVITSSSVADAIDVIPQKDLFVADSPSEWTSAVNLLLSDQSLAAQLGQEARETIIKNYSWTACFKKMQSVISEKNSEPSPLVSTAQLSR